MRRRDFLILSCLALTACNASIATGGARFMAWGGPGNRPGEFRQPRAIGAHDGEVYVVDKTGRIQVFGEDGEYRRGWSTPSADNGTPTCVAFSARGTVLVPDTHYSRIIEYTTEGEELSRWGQYGTGEDTVIYPTGIVEGSDGLYYLSEYGVDAERVHVFDKKGDFVRLWGEFGEDPGQFNRAMAILLDTDETLLVVDSANHRVQRFTTEGKLLGTMGGLGDEPGQLEFPFDGAMAPDRSIFVAEYGNHRISRFAPTGEIVATYGVEGRGEGQFNAPRGVAVSASGAVFIADTDNHRIQRMEVAPWK